MTATSETLQNTPIVYPSADGVPVAETDDHLYAILTTLEFLKQHLAGRQATILANQFLYYAQGLPKLRTAPDVMVIFDVAPGGRDNYKIWEEGQVPAVIFEMTSKGTEDQDKSFKKTLYEQLGVQEYWLFDPKGEWIPEKLQGYRLRGETYELIRDSRSEPLELRLGIEGKLIRFYQEDTQEKLLIPDELVEALKQATQARLIAEEQAQQERQQRELAQQQLAEIEAVLDRYRKRFGELPK
jgi:hypothetical protein